MSALLLIRRKPPLFTLFFAFPLVFFLFTFLLSVFRFWLGLVRFGDVFHITVAWHPPCADETILAASVCRMRLHEVSKCSGRVQRSQ